MYNSFDWYWNDTTGMYAHLQSLQSNPSAFLLALLSIDKERHKHDIAALQKAMAAMEKKKPAYNIDEDLATIATLKSEMSDIDSSIKAIQNDQKKRPVARAQVAPAPKRKRHTRRLFFFGAKHL